MSKRSSQSMNQRPWKLLLWTAVAGLLFGLVGFGEIAEDYLRTVRNSLHPHKASGQVVLVNIDDRSLREFGNWPWSRTLHARLVDRLTAEKANRIFFDINFSYPAKAAEDRAFADALKRSGKVTLATRFKAGSQQGAERNAQQGDLAAAGFGRNCSAAGFRLHRLLPVLPTCAVCYDLATAK